MLRKNDKGVTIPDYPIKPHRLVFLAAFSIMRFSDKLTHLWDLVSLSYSYNKDFLVLCFMDAILTDQGAYVYIGLHSGCGFLTQRCAYRPKRIVYYLLLLSINAGSKSNSEYASRYDSANLVRWCSVVGG